MWRNGESSWQKGNEGIFKSWEAIKEDERSQGVFNLEKRKLKSDNSIQVKNYYEKEADRLFSIPTGVSTHKDYSKYNLIWHK